VPLFYIYMYVQRAVRYLIIFRLMLQILIFILDTLVSRQSS